MKLVLNGTGSDQLLRAIAFGPDAPTVALPSDAAGDVGAFTLTFERETIDVTSFGDTVRRFVPGALRVSVRLVSRARPSMSDEYLVYAARLPDGTMLSMRVAARTCTHAAGIDAMDTWTVAGEVVNAAELAAAAAAQLPSTIAALEAQGPPKPAPKPAVPAPPSEPPPARGIRITGDF